MLRIWHGFWDSCPLARRTDRLGLGLSALRRLHFPSQFRLLDIKWISSILLPVAPLDSSLRLGDSGLQTRTRLEHGHELLDAPPHFSFRMIDFVSFWGFCALWLLSVVLGSAVDFLVLLATWPGYILGSFLLDLI